MTFQATDEFWKNFYALDSGKKRLVREKWKIFKADINDIRLRTHKIHKLSGIAGHPILAAVIESDLRIIFRIDVSVVTTLDIGTHSIYN